MPRRCRNLRLEYILFVGYMQENFDYALYATGNLVLVKLDPHKTAILEKDGIEVVGFRRRSTLKHRLQNY